MRWRGYPLPAGLFVLAVLSPAPSPAADTPPDPNAPDAYKKHVVPLVARYCGSCHGEAKQSADLNLARFADEAAVAKDQAAWRKVLTNLSSRDMPPASKPQPTEAERAFLTAWVDRKLTALGCVKEARNPGRVTMRRLNRAEYNNTIRDLVGVEFRPADDFPSDDVGYGFDNIGDVLSLPPLLLEKYLAAAEQVLDKAIVTGDELTAKSERWQARAWRPSGRFQAAGDGSRNLFSNGDLTHTHQFPAEGEYILKVKAHGDQAGPDAVKMSLQLDGKEFATADVKSGNASRPDLIEQKFRAPAGEHKLSVAFVNDFYDEKTKADRNLIVHEVQLLGPLNAKVTLPETHTRIFSVTPKTPAERPAAAEKILGEFARRAWRRPVSAEEIARLMKLYRLADSKGEPFEKAISLALSGVLVSPHFLFRVEPERPTGLNDHELASRLSYFLWSSMPDERLFKLAAEGKLRDPAVLEAEARRMLADPKSTALVQNFAGQWLQLRNLRTLTPDRRTYPAWNDQLRNDMIRETELFFETIVKEDRDVLEFLDADYTFLNERLAKHYGIPDVKGEPFRKVTLADRNRGGVLTQASVLTVTSNPTRTSPVKRGKWVLENLLGTPPPPPPPDVPELDDGKKAALTGSLRQRMEQHRQKAVCASCHNRMDPLGFGLENFDGVGGWRAKDGGFLIDPSGTLPGGQSFSGPTELKAVLKTRADDFRRCLTEKLLTYALGRGLEYYDKCAVDVITDALKKRQNKFSVLVTEIVRSEPFRMRRPAQGGE